MQGADRFSVRGHVLIAALLGLLAQKLKRHELRLRGPREGRAWRNDLPNPAPAFDVSLVPEVSAKIVERLPKIARRTQRALGLPLACRLSACYILN
jgi:hypothetical protein